ncbi:MAG: RecQ family zinc-binding domain-containing protein, partial [Gemmataceae bacterium]|nr:RecQ family zinc-binding domain-containing protein [Gemmataceae bacterium]
GSNRLTATATPHVIDDIKTRLRIHDAEVVHTGFYRPNLELGVLTTHGEAQKRAALLQLLDETEGTAVVYCATVKAVEEVTEFLASQSMVAAGYHGKMPAKRRASVQERFMNGELHRFVATNAFGLGIDKADIRAVIHYHMPGSLESYYQEMGRAGRDGLPSRCTLLYDPQDRKLQRFFQGGRYPDDTDLVNVYHALERLAGREELPTLKQVQAISPLKPARTKVCLTLLTGQGVTERLRGDRYKLLKPGLERDAIAAKARSYREKEELDKATLQRMADYAEGRKCRWQTLLSYFEDDALALEPCYHCDRDPEKPDEATRLLALRKSVELMAGR